MSENPKRDVDEDPSDIAWGAAEIGETIGRDVRQTFYLLERGHLPAAKVGRIWTASKRKLRSKVTGEVQ